MRTARRRWLWVALSVAAGVSAYLVLAPEGTVPSLAVSGITELLVGSGAPGWLANDDVVAFVLNVALFVPAAFVAALLWRRAPWWAWALLGLVISGAVETTQALFLSQRLPQIADLVANSFGAALGGLLALAVRRRSPVLES